MREYHYVIRSSGRWPVSENPRVIQLLSAGPSHPSLEIPLVVENRPPVAVVPSMLFAHVSKGTANAKFLVSFVANELEEPLEVRPETMMMGLSYRTKLREHARQVLEVGINASDFPEKREPPSYLEFRTNHPLAPMVKVRLLLQFRGLVLGESTDRSAIPPATP